MPRYINDVTDAPRAIGPYSQAVVAGSFVFTSGQIPLDPATGKLVTGGIEAQTVQVLKNLQAILAQQGLTFADVAQSRIYLTDLSAFQTVNRVYGEFLGDNRPARATVQVAALPLGAEIEIEMLAVLV